MCGIAGIIRWKQPEQPDTRPDAIGGGLIPDSWLDVLDGAVAFRGPDGRGRFRDFHRAASGAGFDVAFVHRRLSIIDPAGGGQPMCWPPGRGLAAAASPTHHTESRQPLLCTSFNGCIYNHQHLRGRLSACGARFETRSDTETLLHAYREWRSDVTQNLEGMYAFSIWDRATASVTLARDPYGEKPLYLTFIPQRASVAWASTAAALYRLRLHMGVPTPLEPAALAGWIAYGRGLHDTPWKDIVAVRPGEQLTFGHVPFAFNSREIPPPRSELGVDGTPSLAACMTEHQLLDTLGRLIDASVALRMDADVPVVCFLSGGVDSSLVAAAAAKAHPGLTTICVSMPDAEFDESDFARQAAGIIGSTHVTEECHTDAAAVDLCRLIGQIGLPFGDSSLLPTHWAAQAASRHGGVVLTGDGGDELFLGYQRMMAAPWVHRLRGISGLASPLTGVLGHASPRSRLNKLGRLLEAAASDGYAELLRIFPGESATSLMPGIVLAAPSLDPHTPREAQHFEIREHLPNDMLLKVDTATMGVPIEARAPFLSSTIHRAVASLDYKRLIPGGKRKGLLRALAEQTFPRAMIERPKQGFAIPIGRWFREDRGGLGTLLHDTLSSRDAFSENVLGLLIDRRYVRCLLDDHMRTRRDHAQRLHMLLVLAIWTRWCEGASRGQ